MNKKRMVSLVMLLIFSILLFTLAACDASKEEEAAAAPALVAAVIPETEIESTNILVYENVKSSADFFGRPLDARVSGALFNSGLTGANIVEVDENVTELLIQLKSSTKWDLIIIASESRDFILGGEVWTAIYDELNQSDTKLIAEVWYLDQIISGQISPLMDACGVQLHKNMIRNADSAIADYIIYGIIEDHPIFRSPNEITGMIVPVGDYAWQGDVGDLLKLSRYGNATILGGQQLKVDDEYGAIVECLDGRMILQTLSTHDLSLTDSNALWENYIQYVLQ
jgi:hypothetical protein